MKPLSSVIIPKDLVEKTQCAFKGEWKNIPIEENGEPLVLVPNDFSCPFYSDVMKISHDRKIFVRKSVLLMLIKARRTVNKLGMDLKVYDGWRSFEIQESLYWLYMKQFSVPNFPDLLSCFAMANSPNGIKKIFYSLDDDMRDILHNLNKIYVSWPSKDHKSPSPHITGGAVDVWLFKGNKPLDLGVEFDSMEEAAGAFYHLLRDRKYFNNDDMVCYYRNILLRAMTEVGFSCYPPEIWHFNYGNQMHSLVTGSNACYSFIEP